jgi:hypothetical protein
MAAMMVVFEVHVAPGGDPNRILSAETLRETQAQVMTSAEAKKVGFAGLPEPPFGHESHEVRLVAVAKRDAAWIQRALEANDAVGQFRVFDVD